MALVTRAGLSVVAHSLTVSVPDAHCGGERKTLLEKVSFRIEPGEFVCVLGPSGAGKSTLARSLLGEREIAAGRLLVGGHDVFREVDALRGAIGYVPQRDVNPPALPVERALHYASHVRLPAETSDAERWAAIDRAIVDVGLDGVRQGTIGSLSGGEMKRASLAAELLAAPGLLVLDEATSSLDPATESRIMTLLSERARAGTTVITVTHHLDNVDKADKLLILGHGEVVWFGSRVEALGHFGVHRLADVYVAIEDQLRGFWSARWREREAEDHRAAEARQADERSGTAAPERAASLAAVSTPGFGRQFATFFRRELETVARDRVGLVMTALLPLALAAAVLAGFADVRFRNPLMLTRFLDPGEKDVLADVWGEVSEAIATESVSEQDASIPGQIRVFLDSQPKLLAHLREPSTERLVRDALTDTLPVAPDREILDPGGTYKWLSLMSICMVILGFVTGFREIVKERPMLDLERRHGLWFAAYVIAKVAALAVVLAVQVAFFRSAVEFGFMLREAIGGESPAEIYRRGAFISASLNWLAAVACAAMGLIVSACVRSTDKGVLVVPLLITPQILLGATILPIKGGVLAALAKLFSPLYWAHRGCRSEGGGVPAFWQNLGTYDPALWIPYAALLAQIVVATLITILLLRWQERAALGRNRSQGLPNRRPPCDPHRSKGPGDFFSLCV
ncbi:ABC transporter ATP-binding protein/permease [bacterium]|nr:ABC transporter ATP-binding protein/permease [bacterium]